MHLSYFEKRDIYNYIVLLAYSQIITDLDKKTNQFFLSQFPTNFKNVHSCVQRVQHVNFSFWANNIVELWSFLLLACLSLIEYFSCATANSEFQRRCWGNTASNEP